MYPNGMMHIWSGLLLRVANEDQLVSVLAHELAHYLRTHQITQWRRLRSGLTVTTLLDATLTFGLASLAYAGDSAAFSREQEKEADLYGLQLMVDYGYSPEAAQSLWKYVIHERNKDNSKGKRGRFLATHPLVKDRVRYLGELAQEYRQAGLVKENKNIPAKNKLVEHITPHYVQFMKSQLDLREYEQVAEIIKRHRNIGYPPALIDFYEGELYRLRNEENDRALAIASYESALEHKNDLVPVTIYRELGYLYLKEKSNQAALNFFGKYLEADSGASDKEMILFYTDSLKGT
jgi:predicted Zn-dependent protease